MQTLQWWIDASSAVHLNCHSHTGAILSIGRGTIYFMLSKQKVNTRSSTEAELVGIDRILTYGTLLDVLWQMYHPWITYGTVRRIV